MKGYRGVCLLFLAAAGAYAQTATSTIQGIVKDRTGAVIVGTKVKLTNEETGQAREQRSNTEGYFEFRALPRGEYTLEGEQAGFKKQVVTNITLAVAQTQDVPIVLQVGGVTESVEVQASAGLLQTSEASLSQVIDNPNLSSFCINGPRRNINLFVFCCVCNDK